jgi:hypothetical protein
MRKGFSLSKAFFSSSPKYLIIVFAVLSIFILPHRSFASIGFQVDTNGTLTTGLVSYWNLQGNSNDYASSNNGTDSGVSYNTSYGKVNEGGNYNSGSGYTSIPDNSALSPSSISVATWLYMPSLPSTYNRVIDKRNGNYGWHWGIKNGGATLYWEVGNGSTITDREWSYSFAANTWYDIVITQTGTTANLYVNGSSVAGGSGSPQTISNASGQALLFGKGIDGDGSAFYLDEIGIWSKILSSQEITDLYNSGSGQTMTGGAVTVSLSSPQQYRSDITSTIPEGGTTMENTMAFGATLTTSGTSTLKLEVEVESAGSNNFTGTVDSSSTVAVSSGGYATSTYVFGASTSSNGSYHWQARVIDGNGVTSTWQMFGVTATSTDFIINFDQPKELATTTLFTSDPSLVAYYRVTMSIDTKGNGTIDKVETFGPSATDISQELKPGGPSSSDILNAKILPPMAAPPTPKPAIRPYIPPISIPTYPTSTPTSTFSASTSSLSVDSTTIQIVSTSSATSTIINSSSTQ